MGEKKPIRNDETHKSQVDAETTARVIAEKRIGERIKRLRLKKSMGLVELGKHTGLSASFLSQLETGRVVPTLRNLARIAMVFSKDLSYFFESEPQSIFRIHRQKERVRLPQPDRRSSIYGMRRSGRPPGPRTGPPPRQDRIHPGSPAPSGSHPVCRGDRSPRGRPEPSGPHQGRWR